MVDPLSRYCYLWMLLSRDLWNRMMEWLHWVQAMLWKKLAWVIQESGLDTRLKGDLRL